MSIQDIRLGPSCDQGTTGVLSYSLHRLAWSRARRGGAVSGRGWSGSTREGTPLWVLPPDPDLYGGQRRGRCEYPVFFRRLLFFFGF